MVLVTGPTVIELYKHKRWLQAGNFRFRKKSNCTIRVAKIKLLISFAVTVKLICAFVLAFAKYLISFLSYDVAVFHWITSCHKNHITTRVLTLLREYVTSLTTSVTTM